MLDTPSIEFINPSLRLPELSLRPEYASGTGGYQYTFCEGENCGFISFGVSQLEAQLRKGFLNLDLAREIQLYHDEGIAPMDLFATFPPRMLSFYVPLVDNARRERLFRTGVEKLKAYPEWARENFRVSDAEDVAYLRVSESAVEQLDTTYVAGLIGVEISEKDSRGIKAMKLRTCFAQKPVDDRFVSSDYNSRALMPIL